MEYRRFGSDCVIRIQKGEEILAALRQVCIQENIVLASVNGIGEVDLHLHMAVANAAKGAVYAGHLNDAKISLTGEFILRIIDGRVEREYSPDVGLNLFRF